MKAGHCHPTAMVLTEKQRGDLHAAIRSYLEAQGGFASTLAAFTSEDPTLKAGEDGAAVVSAREATRSKNLLERKWTSVVRLQRKVMALEGKLKQAEKLYLKVKEPDLAINMYKKARKYDDMIRLVTTYRKDLLKETHLQLAQQLEMTTNALQAR